MGCGISAAVNGLDWYIVSLDQKGAENRVKVGVKVENETFDVEFNNEAKKSGNLSSGTYHTLNYILFFKLII